jgi:hypothetical protein
MSLLTRQASALATGDSPGVLGDIVARHVHLALWRRPRPAALDWLDTLVWDGIEDLDFTVTLALLDEDVAEGLEEAGYPQDARGTALLAEVLALARRFAAIMACPALRLRLEVVDSDACRKFHADHVRARLLCTLSGRGTQWIAPAQGPQPAIHQLATGDVGLFKGRLWAEQPAILHRSPPIAAMGETRLLLVLDPLPQGGADTPATPPG